MELRKTRVADRKATDPVSDDPTRLKLPPAMPTDGLRIVALGGIGEIGRNMTVFEYAVGRGPTRLLVVDCGMLLGKTNAPGVDLALPDWSFFRDRLDDIDADRAHPRPRGPHRRAALPAARAGRHPAGRVPADPGADQRQARPAPHQARPAPGARGRTHRHRPVEPGVLRGQPLHPGRARGGHPYRRPHRAAHRRLQDGPDAAGRPAHRPARFLAARRRGRRPAAGRLDQRRGSRLHPQRARRGQGRQRRHPQGPGPGHRRLLRLPHPPGAAGARRRPRVAAVRWRWSGARWCATWASPATSAC